MTRHFFWLFLLLAVPALNVTGQWRIVARNAVSPSNGNQLPFGPGSQGVITFQHGVLWAGFSDLAFSSDTGRTWTVTNLPKTPVISAVSFLNQNVGLASNGYIEGYDSYWTTDRGTTWTTSKLDLLQVYCASPTTAFGVNYEPTGFYETTDAGNSWHVLSSFDGTDFQVRPNGVIYALITDMTTTMSRVGISADSGHSWTTGGGNFIFDSYSMGLDSCDASTLYVTSENYYDCRPDSLARLFRSSDGGASWQATFTGPFGSLAGSFCSSVHAQYAATISNGILRSTDKGLTWKNIGGPGNVIDSRCICAINDNIIFALDSAGNIWATFNSGGDSISASQSYGAPSLVLFSGITTVKRTDCINPRDTTVSIGLFNGCSKPSGVLDSLWLSGSSAFSISESTSLPRSLEIVDSISVSYSGTIGNDTSVLHLRYDLGSGPEDTSVILIGVAQLPAERAQLHRESASAYWNEVDSLPLELDIQGPLDSLWFCSAIYAWDSSIVNYAGYIPPPGWEINAVFNRGNSAEIEIFDTTYSVSQPLDLGTALFRPVNSELATSWVQLTSLLLDEPGKYLSFCLNENEDNHWAVKTLGVPSDVQMKLSDKPEFSIVPNPSNGRAYLTSNVDLGEATVEIYTMLGTKVLAFSVSVSANRSIEVQLPESSGVYTVMIRSAAGIFTLRVLEEH